MFDITTHNGIITALNPATGQHRTFRVRTQPADHHFAPGERIVSLLVGPDDYQGFGFVTDDVRLWRRFAESKAYRFFRSMLRTPDRFALEYNFEGRCRRCNRPLTTPQSVALGIGPICRGK